MRIASSSESFNTNIKQQHLISSSIFNSKYKYEQLSPPITIYTTLKMARTTTTRKPSLLARLRGAPKTTTTTHTTTTTTRRSPRTGILGGRKNKRTNNYNTTTGAPVQHHRRKVSMGDKVSGAMMKLRGSLTRRPGLKVSFYNSKNDDDDDDDWN